MKEYIEEYVDLILFRYRTSHFVSKKSLDILEWFLLYDMYDSNFQKNQIKSILIENGREVHN